MHEDSTPDQPQIMRYTKNTQAKQRKERKYRNIRQSVKHENANIGQAEPIFAQHNVTAYIFNVCRSTLQGSDNAFQPLF
jgi:hypothetical protein